MAEASAADWPALDAYDKHAITALLHACGTSTEAVVYTVPTTLAATSDARHRCS